PTAELLDQAALPDPRLARHAGRSAFAQPRLAMERGQPLEGALATHQGRQEPLAPTARALARRQQIQLLVHPGAPLTLVIAEADQILGHLCRALIALLHLLR